MILFEQQQRDGGRRPLDQGARDHKREPAAFLLRGRSQRIAATSPSSTPECTAAHGGAPHQSQRLYNLGEADARRIRHTTDIPHIADRAANTIDANSSAAQWIVEPHLELPPSPRPELALACMKHHSLPQHPQDPPLLKPSMRARLPPHQAANQGADSPLPLSRTPLQGTRPNAAQVPLARIDSRCWLPPKALSSGR